MRTLVVVNPAAGSAHLEAEIASAVAERPEWMLARTVGPGHAHRLASEAAGRGFARVVAAGGDGTVHEVIEGLTEHGPAGAVGLGIVPMGTGNDLARTLDVPNDVAGAIAILDRGDDRAIDLIRIDHAERRHFCINLANGGFAVDVQQALTDELKASWGPLAYVRGAAAVVPNRTAHCVRIALDDDPIEPVSALAVIVANARFAAGGVQLAPLADPEDGLLDLVIVHDGTLLELAGVGLSLARGNLFASDEVVYRRGRRVRIESDPPMGFSVDGEPLVTTPLEMTVVPRALRVVVGPGYSCASPEVVVRTSAA